MTTERLLELVNDGLLQPITNHERPEQIAPGEDKGEPRPRDGYIVSFVSFHERGFRMPASRFMCALLHYYGVELHNFAPNSISQAAIFAAVYEGYLRITPYQALWLHLFRAELFTKVMDGRGSRKAMRVGGCTLQLHQDWASLYTPAQLTLSNHGWQEGWFYLRNDDNGLPPYTGWVVTAKPDFWKYDVPGEEQPPLWPLLDALQRLRDHGLTAAGVATAFCNTLVLSFA